ncbi:hypothetical protein [Methylobacterium sp. AMS5]|uniref:hypothetical protein n=1 Tax=Methylobacterium sp. AMS5 TaxID=925818 RepID=UPI001910519E|nr:hypothetical protein [Methylobacterium sp. AMS5]
MPVELAHAGFRDVEEISDRVPTVTQALRRFDADAGSQGWVEAVMVGAAQPRLLNEQFSTLGRRRRNALADDLQNPIDMGLSIGHRYCSLQSLAINKPPGRVLEEIVKPMKILIKARSLGMPTKEWLEPRTETAWMTIDSHLS